MSQSNVPDWLSWVVPVITAGGVLWAGARRLFVTVTREELASILKESDNVREAHRLQLHQENLDRFEALFDRLGDVETNVAEIRGELKARRP